jgi:hypothetical protein
MDSKVSEMLESLYHDYYARIDEQADSASETRRLQDNSTTVDEA